MNRKNSIREWINTGLLSVCAISLVIIAILLVNLPKVLQTTPEKSDTSTVNTVASSVTETKSIKTAYGDIQFPFGWDEYLEYEEIKSEKVTECVFYCKLGDEKIELYRVAFGEADEDSIVGYLERDDERIPVTIHSSEIQVDGYSDEDLGVLQSMSGTYNDVLVSISQWDGFVYE